MANPIYALLSRQAALRQQVDILANNVANLSTSGFKREGLVFATQVERLDLPGRTLSLAELRSSYTDLQAGPLQRTGNDLDLATHGDGFFAVETPQGVHYTKDGRFSMNALGELVTVSGHRVLDEGGAAIVLPLEVSRIGVSPMGPSAPRTAARWRSSGYTVSPAVSTERPTGCLPPNWWSQPWGPRSSRASSKPPTSIRSAS
jgi:flagellar basal-body rod protein FlgF